jgi:hypothetical protein
MTCSNGVKQITLALHNYHDANNVFPIGCSGTLGPGNGTNTGNREFLSPHGFVLPYIEQNALHAMWVEWIKHRSPWDANDTLTINGATLTNPHLEFVQSFFCASDSRGPNMGSGLKGTNYAFCMGDWAGGNHVNRDGGVMFDPAGRGAFTTKTERGMGSLADGTSNTIGVLERCIGLNSSVDRAVVSQVVAARLSSVSTPTQNEPRTAAASTSVFPDVNPDDCMATLDGKTYRDGLSYHSIQNNRWGQGTAGYTMIGTIMPPNSAACRSTTGDDSSYYLVGPTSKHTGGVNGGLMDGSVRFFTDSVNARSNGVTFPYTLKSTGQSPFGVWGALGSINGGESTTL